MDETLGIIIQSGKIFDVISITDTSIAELEHKYMPLTIKSTATIQAKILSINTLTDGEIAELSINIKKIKSENEFKQIHEGKMIMIHNRNDVVKEGKRVREKANKFIKDALAEEHRVIKLMEPIEGHLTTEEEAILAAERAVITELEQRKDSIIQARRDRLLTFGMGLFGMNWKLPFDAPGSEVPEPLLKVCSDDQFEKFCAAIQEAIDKEQAWLLEIEKGRLAEERRLADIAAEQEVERKRLEALAKEREAQQEAERKRLEELAKEQAAREAKIKADQEAIEAEKKHLAEAEAARLKAIEDEKVRVENEAKRQAELVLARKEAAEIALRDAEEKAKQEAKEKADKEEKERIAAEKRLAKLPDKESLLRFIRADAAMVRLLPNLKTDEYKAILEEYQSELALIIQKFIDRVNAL